MDTLGILALVLLQIPNAAVRENSKLPESLRRAYAARDPTVCFTGLVEWRVVDNRPRVAGTQYFRWRCAGEDLISEFLGDENGVTLLSEDGSVPVEGHRAVRALQKDGERWVYRDQSTTAAIQAQRAPSSYVVPDLRQIGLNPVIAERPLYMLDQWWKGHTTEYEETSENGLIVVTEWLVRDGNRRGRCRTWIDPERGWNVVRTQGEYDGKRAGTTNIDLSLVDNIWFPARVTSLNSDGEAVHTIEVLHSEFNRPEHPTALTVQHLGLEPGVSVMNEAIGLGFIWDGEELLVPGEWLKRVADGRATPGPTVTREYSRLLARSSEFEAPTSSDVAIASAPSTKVEAHILSDWEQYTKSFIELHKLSPDQTSRAWQICRDCQSQALGYLSRRRAEFAKLERPDSQPTTSSAPTGVAKDAERLEELMAPIHAIFESKLKPRLHSLLTREQWKAASQPTSGR
ncbi:MAG: hypothetical protein SF069_16930 [Phycisphaerae bacterium]|nr:hypothetical protein [Phycisphaerae bacterium]